MIRAEQKSSEEVYYDADVVNYLSVSNVAAGAVVDASWEGRTHARSADNRAVPCTEQERWHNEHAQLRHHNGAYLVCIDGNDRILWICFAESIQRGAHGHHRLPGSRSCVRCSVCCCCKLSSLRLSMLHSVFKQLPAWTRSVSPGAPGVICVKINYYFNLLCCEY